MDERFLKIVAEVLKIDPARLREDDTSETLPEWDSLNHWAVITELEDAYDVEFTMDEATGFKNLGDIYAKLKRKTGTI